MNICEAYDCDEIAINELCEQHLDLYRRHIHFYYKSDFEEEIIEPGAPDDEE